MSITRKIIAPRYDEVYFEAIEQMDKAEAEWNNYLDTMAKVEKEMDAIPQNQNKQAFDTLYNTIQEIGDITQRAIRDGEPGHKPALHEIMKICRGGLSS